MPCLSAYRLTWVSLTLDVWYLHGCSSKVEPLLLTLDEGYLLTATPPDLEFILILISWEHKSLIQEGSKVY